MTNAELQQQRFWDLFNKELEAQGNPFVIKHRKHYATINKRSSDSGFCLGLDFLYKNNLIDKGLLCQLCQDLFALQVYQF